MGSRIHREVYVRFRGEAMETCLGDKARRCGLSLQSAKRADFAIGESLCLQDETGRYEAARTTDGFNFIASGDKVGYSGNTWAAKWRKQGSGVSLYPLDPPYSRHSGFGR